MATERTPEEKQAFLERLPAMQADLGRPAASMTFMSVERPTIQKAFALAHRLACNADIPDRERKYFRAIAHLIWKSCGESGPADSARQSSVIQALGHIAQIQADSE